MIGEAVDEEVDTTLLRNRKRTETKEPSTLDNAFKELQKAVSYEIQRLREKNRILRDKLLQEREKQQKTQEELYQQREKRVLECNICYR
ncbi:uncharacterized protein N7458_004287 [Penicillium daleae]|uniref:Uncharacterized protein n=1 Tax=Penicillium daleae TaxID=63821 RepID=A0AAD6G5P4_9EURO|nr:uncharacterized protein N7458_004287 [Penicillium daleae]KAJ5456023.1 hypothetical protein N7458_004287 [Penicillium daleae]